MCQRTLLRIAKSVKSVLNLQEHYCSFDDQPASNSRHFAFFTLQTHELNILRCFEMKLRRKMYNCASGIVNIYQRSILEPVKYDVSWEFEAVVPKRKALEWAPPPVFPFGVIPRV